MKTHGIIMKTYHVDPNDKVWDTDFHEKMDRTLLHQDLTPFIKYSINKKKRWETNGSIANLQDLQKTYRGMDVVISDRVWLGSSPMWCFVSHENYFHHFFDNFPIRQIHQLTLDGSYECLSSDSVYGQPLKSLTPKNRSPNKIDDAAQGDFSIPKVAYHIITPPKNYEKLRNGDFQPGSSDRCCTHRTLTHWRRVKNLKYVLASLRYEEFEDLDEDMDMTDDYLVYDDCGSPRKFYNLEDHLVDNFVFVKRRNAQISDDSMVSAINN
ncbi:hypothetical protein CAEBREN_10559 [Caenorhabditis brenneri]|uniref:C49G7.10 n=1 Tax=Caenorhabditis brenneri TaxID=135651 RepID=G0NHN2_CAEBE|nr:hypothetical protein CAEBREN_10559 [Caenorhabditis brenneri]